MDNKIITSINTKHLLHSIFSVTYVNIIIPNINYNYIETIISQANKPRILVWLIITM